MTNKYGPMASKKVIMRSLFCISMLGCIGALLVSSQPRQDRHVTQGFTHGIASGDPGKNSVVLWTRYVDQQDSVELTYEVSDDKQFQEILRSGKAVSYKANNYCVKVIADGLLPGQPYFYRFREGQILSDIGQTKTLPLDSKKLTIGVVNCAKYTGGYYHAYDALAKMEDIDVVIHLGDYIYENGPSTPKSSYWQAFQATGRQHDPMHECVTLTDYRTRYAQYRSDTSLQKLHARFPMIPIWDDHEIAMKQHKKNEAGKQVFNENWEDRRDHSIQAYHEWLPLKPNAFDPIYRSFQFGDLVNLLMLDTRVCCRSAVDKTKESLQDTSRHIIGNQQLRWIVEEVETHESAWNVFGNQLLISEKGMGWNRWPGFPYDRDRFLAFVESNPSKNFVFTTGNAHNPHHYLVFNEDQTDTLLHELLPGSISSGNNAEKARFDTDILLKEEQRLTAAENVRWFDQNSHGFIVLEIEKEKLEATWYAVSSIWTESYELRQAYSFSIPTNNQSKKKY